jgi:hypothetical protein
MLLDPSEEQLNLPATPVKLCESQGWNDKVVRQESKHLIRLSIIIAGATKFVWILFGGVDTGKHYGLIAFQSKGFVYWMRI